jgi:hypothetical protein
MVAIQRASTNVAMVQNVGIYSLTNICRSSDVAIHTKKLNDMVSQNPVICSYIALSKGHGETKTRLPNHCYVRHL